MQVDVTISFFRRQELWPLVERSLSLNAEHIARVIIVNDEPWGEWLPTSSAFPIVTYEFPAHNGFGVSRCINKGIELANTEYVLHLDDDTVLQKDMLGNMLQSIEPDLLLCNAPWENTVEEAAKLLLLDAPREATLSIAAPTHVYPFKLIAGCIWMAKREHLLQTRWNEEMVEYGLQDYEFACRWQTKFGRESLVRGTFGGCTINSSNTASTRLGETNLQFLSRVVRTYKERHGYAEA